MQNIVIATRGKPPQGRKCQCEQVKGSGKLELRRDKAAPSNPGSWSKAVNIIESGEGKVFQTASRTICASSRAQPVETANL